MLQIQSIKLTLPVVRPSAVLEGEAAGEAIATAATGATGCENIQDLAIFKTKPKDMILHCTYYTSI